MMTERREFPRHDVIHLTDFLALDQKGESGTYSMGRTLDVSLKGLKLETATPLSQGSKLQLTVGVNDKLLRLTGTVSHSHAQQGRYVSGITLNKAKSQDREILSRYVEGITKRKSSQ